MKLFLYIVALMLLLAVVNMPYGFYQLLRLVTVLAFITMAYREYQRVGWNIWVTMAILGVLVMNPVYPIKISKGLWQIINPLMAVVIGTYAYRLTNIH